MKLPTLQGIIHRRILTNFRVDPAVMQRHLPARFRPKLHKGFAVAGICLIRLDHIRPKLTPAFVGLSSENAAHRVAVYWDENGQTREGVFITRRDTGSTLNHLTGGRIFPGEHHYANFQVTETATQIRLAMQSDDGAIAVQVEGEIAEELPATSIFSSVEEASQYFAGGALGYSVTADSHRLDGITLVTKKWHVEPLEIHRVHSSYFSDETRFPAGSIMFDHALIMRNVAHEWHAATDLYV
ncbi:MAG TPA: DUF2071 domain-containing protein [Blastocatellia bacterium]|nr:DUF2071 domain-containing protein [Blastocatellia bacterium]